jgi:hypothetical protein
MPQFWQTHVIASFGFYFYNFCVLIYIFYSGNIYKILLYCSFYFSVLWIVFTKHFFTVLLFFRFLWIVFTKHFCTVLLFFRFLRIIFTKHFCTVLFIFSVLRILFTKYFCTVLYFVSTVPLIECYKFLRFKLLVYNIRLCIPSMPKFRTNPTSILVLLKNTFNLFSSLRSKSKVEETIYKSN